MGGEIDEKELRLAISEDNTTKMNEFLQTGLDVNYILSDNRTLLKMAVEEKKDKIVELLVKKKCDVNMIGKIIYHSQFVENNECVCLDKTCIYHAICHNQIQSTRLLVAGNINLQLRDDLGCTALWHAVDAGFYNITEILLATRKCNVNQQDFHGLAPLHVAALHGDHKLVQLLIRYRASVDLPQIEGATALCLACTCGATSVVRSLLQNGADPIHLTDNNNLAPLSLAVQHGAKREIIMLLLLAGAQLPYMVRFLSYPGNMKGTHMVKDFETYNWLCDLAATPKSLKDHCALRIRHMLMEVSRGITISLHIEKLPLPNILKDYLHLKHLP